MYVVVRFDKHYTHYTFDVFQIPKIIRVQINSKGRYVKYYIINQI